MQKPARFGHTKILCTLGPASAGVARIRQLIDAGMDVARLNFSHGSHEAHRDTLTNLRTAAAASGEAIAVLQDLSGPKIRIGEVQGGSVELEEGQKLVITTAEVMGTRHRVSTVYTALPSDVVAGDTILLDDGKIRLRVEGIENDEVITTVMNGGPLSSHKGMNLPGVKISAPALTDKDVEDLRFGLANGVDYVALSFVRAAEDVRHLRAVIARESPDGRRVPIVAKIEKGEALEDIDSIIEAADAIMVARGDLGVEMPPEDVPLLQKMIVRKCNDAGKPVIIATQMLESMILNPRPTRAEASDVANAVLDGADAVMLSAETSVGAWPVEAVQTMDNIICRAEQNRVDRLGTAPQAADAAPDLSDAVARAACILARQLRPAAIVTITHSGVTAQQLARYRPLCRIIGVTRHADTLRRLNLVWGVRGLLVPDLSDEIDHAYQQVQDAMVAQGLVGAGDQVVYTAGLPLSGKGVTNSLKIAHID
ncbi:MAG: pyruvate kinase [Gammaproteobacteria bacterium]|nr:pyruvate kinase [Gammaproteobacteria bacterium]